MKKNIFKNRVVQSTLAIALIATSLQGCIFALAGAGTGIAMASVDRRTLGSQTEDKAIQIKAKTLLTEHLPKQSIVSITSFNRHVLLSGVVSSETDKIKAEQLVRQVYNIEAIANEIQVVHGKIKSTSTSDTYLLTKVKSLFLSTKGIHSSIYKVVVDHGSVYLMGIVTPEEANNAANVASTVKGVKRVVKVFQYIDPAELKKAQSRSSDTRAPQTTTNFNS